MWYFTNVVHSIQLAVISLSILRTQIVKWFLRFSKWHRSPSGTELNEYRIQDKGKLKGKSFTSGPHACSPSPVMESVIITMIILMGHASALTQKTVDTQLAELKGCSVRSKVGDAHGWMRRRKTLKETRDVNCLRSKRKMEATVFHKKQKWHIWKQSILAKWRRSLFTIGRKNITNHGALEIWIKFWVHSNMY